MNRLFIILVFVSFPGILFAETLCVPSAYSTIQSAISASSDGDTVLVADGSYSGNGNKNIDFLGRGIVVRSENGPDGCIINCENDGRGFIFHNDETATSVLFGFTITNGWVMEDGGGIYCDEAEPQITNCIITHNRSWDEGGGISIHDGSPIIENCIIENNISIDGQGGGLDIIFAPNPVIRNCTIRYNSSPDHLGGGINCTGWSSPSFENCSFIGNTARVGGGGMWIGPDSDALISDCIFDGNVCEEESGGGITIMGCSLTITNCIFTRNRAFSAGGGIDCFDDDGTIIDGCLIYDNFSRYGGGFSIADVDPYHLKVSNCTICYNNAQAAGGGIYCGGGGDPMINNCTIFGNTASGSTSPGAGAGIYCYDSSPWIDKCTISLNAASSPDPYGAGMYISDYSIPIITNTIVARNEGIGGVYFSNYQPPDLNHSAFYSNEGGDFIGSLIPAGLGQLVTTNANGDSCDIYGNILLSPDYIGLDFQDFRLQWGSPCIDTGNPLPQYNDPDGTVADMGAFYYDQSVPVRILLTPHNSPIQLPASGGSFDYTLRLTNIDPGSPPCNVWVDVTLPDGSLFGPLLGPVTAQLDSGLTLSRERTQAIPAGAPGGIYSYNAYTVAGTDTSFDCFSFVKLGSDGWDDKTGWATTGVWIDNSGDEGVSTIHIPTEFCLAQNYPNPFNPTTTIRFGLPDAGQVNLNVYNIAGQKVADLADGWRDAGWHEVVFDGINFCSGLYIYRITAAGITRSHKMLLVK